jgi:hypothetical protein
VAISVLGATTLGAETGFSDGSISTAHGTLVPATIGGLACKGIVTDSTPDTITVVTAAGTFSGLNGTTLLVNGTSYTQSGCTDLGASGVFATYTATGFAFANGVSYNVDLGGGPPVYAGPTIVGTVAATGGAAGFNLNFGSSGRAAGDKLAILVMTANQLMPTPSGFSIGPRPSGRRSRSSRAHNQHHCASRPNRERLTFIRARTWYKADASSGEGRR